MRDDEALKTMLDRAGVNWAEMNPWQDGLHRIEILHPQMYKLWAFDKLGRLARIE